MVSGVELSSRLCVGTLNVAVCQYWIERHKFTDNKLCFLNVYVSQISDNASSDSGNICPPSTTKVCPVI